MVTVVFEVALNHGPTDVAAPGDWTDLSSRVVQPVNTDLGGPNGTASFLLDDDDGGLDPGTLGRVLMRQARLSIDTGTSVLPIWHGLAKRWAPRWRHNQTLRDVVLRDPLAWLAGQDGVDVDLPAQRSEARVNAILDLAGWPAARRDVDAGPRGGVRLGPVVQDGVNLRRLLEDVADAEDGTLWCGPSGDITFRGRLARFDAVSQATLVGDTPAAGDLGLTDQADPSYDTDELYTVAQVQSADGEVIERVASAVELADFGRRVLPLRDLSLPRSEAGVLAEWVVLRFASENVWLPGLEVYGTPDLVLAVGLAVGDLVTVLHDTSTAQTLHGHIERIRHRIRFGELTTTFDLSPVFGEGPWFTWDTAGRGWDQGAKWGP